jgi:hypothetical protein
LVDRLLASPRYGNAWPLIGSTSRATPTATGFQVDRDREMWPWRDWVIKAFDENLPSGQVCHVAIGG